MLLFSDMSEAYNEQLRVEALIVTLHRSTLTLSLRVLYFALHADTKAIFQKSSS